MTRHTRQEAKAHIRKLGWAQQKVAPVLGVGYEHLNRVLNGHRDSRRLIRLIFALPPAPRGQERYGHGNDAPAI